MTLYLLFENASGYYLFENVKVNEIALTTAEVQASISDLKKFSAIVKLKASQPFLSAENALENIMAISEGEITETLHTFLEANLPKIKKKEGEKAKFFLGVLENKLGNAITETLGVKCKSDDVVLELIRGIREHFVRFIKNLKSSDLHQAQLGLSHSFSRSKVKFNVHRTDNMVIQSVSLLDQLDKDLNTFSMRVREWYGYHFPELVKLAADNYEYARLAKLVGDKSKLTQDKLPEIEAIVNDPQKAQQVIDAAKASMGADISAIDLVNVENFASRVVSLSEFRKKLFNYLSDKMNKIAPNLSALIGETVGARLISHAGSLTSLAKYPASTVQILGAEKALFRALKTKGNTPKYGLIFHSSFIGRAGPKNKGRISRYLANKCSIASRIDCFSDVLNTNVFGQKLKEQVEQRLEFYKSGAAPKKNVDVMHEALKEAASLEDSSMADEAPKTEKKKKKDKKRKAEEEPAQEEEVAVEETSKSSKKNKKQKKEKDDDVSVSAAPALESEEPKTEKKKKKKKQEE